MILNDNNLKYSVVSIGIAKMSLLKYLRFNKL